MTLQGRPSAFVGEDGRRPGRAGSRVSGAVTREASMNMEKEEVWGSQRQHRVSPEASPGLGQRSFSLSLLLPSLSLFSLLLPPSSLDSPWAALPLWAPLPPVPTEAPRPHRG